MVNKYVRKTSRPSWDEEVMRLAMEEAKISSVYAAAKKYGINLSTLQNHVKKGCPKNKLGRYKTIFTEDQEKELFALCQTDSLRGLTRKEFLKIAYMYAEARNVQNTFKNGSAGVDWYIGFMKRHPGLCITRARPTGGCYKVYTFCELLEEKMKLEAVENADEVGKSRVLEVLVEVKREVDDTGQDARIVSVSSGEKQSTPQQQFIEVDVLPGPSSAVLDHQKHAVSAAPCRTGKVKVITEETEVEDPLANINSDRQCRFCAKITNNCLDANDKPYVKDNKTTLILNDLNVEIAFNNDKPKVCLDCDKKLLEMFNFVKLVKNSQDALLNVSYDMEETETLYMKTECESPTPDDNNEYDNEDTKEGIVDSITIEETAFLKDNVFVHKKRKCDKDTEQRSKQQKKPKVDDNKVYEHTELIKDIKEEPIEMDDDNKVQTDRHDDRDTGPDVKPSGLAIATNALLDDVAGDVYS